MEASIHHFIYAWPHALVAFFLGKYIKSPKNLPSKFKTLALIYLQVWIVTAVVKFLFEGIAETLHLSELNQVSIAGFILPILIGASFSNYLFQIKAN